MEKNPPITTFDMLSTNPFLQLFKAMLPFFDFPTQKKMAYLVRIQELQQTFAFYQNLQNAHAIRSCVSSPIMSANKSLSELLEDENFIQAVLPYCPAPYRSILQNYKQFSKVSELMQQFSSDGTNNFPMNFSEFFQNKSKDSTPLNFSQNIDSTATDNSNKMPLNGSMSTMLNSMMTPEQQELYDTFLKQLDAVDFSANAPPANGPNEDSESSVSYDLCKSITNQ